MEKISTDLRKIYDIMAVAFVTTVAAAVVAAAVASAAVASAVVMTQIQVKIA